MYERMNKNYFNLDKINLFIIMKLKIMDSQSIGISSDLMPNRNAVCSTVEFFPERDLG